jgi:branched-chain amino acid transport system permease protein
VAGTDTKSSAAATVAGQRLALRRPERPVHLSVTVAFVLFALFGLPPLMNGYYTGWMTQVAIYSIVTLGLGLLVGRVGLYSLGQGAILQIGAWTAARLLFATGQPYVLVIIEAGLVTLLIGGLIGLPAIRLRGLYLALITLMLAGAFTVVLATVNFPNGGGGFTGYNGQQSHIPPIRRPSFAGTDVAYYRFAVVVAVIMFILVYAHLRTRPGRAWAAIRQSEPAALAAGINTTFYKLWAWGLASFITGVAGGVLAGHAQYLYSINFFTQDSIILLAVALMGGVYNLWGAVIAALLYKLLPGVLQNLGLSYAWLYILFGVGVLQVLTTAPTGLADQFPKDMKKLGGLIWHLVRRPHASGASTSAGTSASSSAGGGTT